MSYTPERIAKIRQKEVETSEGLRRDPNVDYYHGWFFVTLNTRDEVPVLSWCEGDVAKDHGEPGAPRCVYTEVGKGVLEAWKKMAEVCKTVEIDLYEAMPEHFHGLVHLLPDNKRHLGSLISGFMSGCSHAYWDTLGIEWRKNRDEKIKAKQMGGKNAYASLTPDRDRDHSHSLIGPALFVHGYNDVEPITEEQVEVKRAYIRDQAKKRLIQGDHHECFRKYRHQHSKNWTVERCMQAIVVDRTFRYDAEKREKAMLNVLGRLNRDACAFDDTNTVVTLPSGRQVGMPGIALDFIGSKALLYSQKKLPLVCHSAEAGRFEEQKEAVMDTARKEWTIVSAFISQKERDIKQQLMVEGLPFIEITDNGYSDRYKGTGKAFYALAENRLCQISPWTYIYQKDAPAKDGEKKVATISREMCLVMNELARVISEREDDWWKTWKDK